MAIPYYGNELIDIAIGIERRGIEFYDNLARTAGSNKAREVFQFLGDMEREHARIFEGMLNPADKTENPETYAGEYGAYLQALADSAVFSDPVTAGTKFAETGNDLTAVALGIQVEKDSILFYYEMRERAPEAERATINRIIDEEKSHLSQLAELRRVLAGG